MEHLAIPAAGADIVPLTQPVYMEGRRVQGTAIAMSQVANTTLYLVVPSTQDSKPVWVSDAMVDVARVGAPD